MSIERGTKYQVGLFRLLAFADTKQDEAEGESKSKVKLHSRRRFNPPIFFKLRF